MGNVKRETCAEETKEQAIEQKGLQPNQKPKGKKQSDEAEKNAERNASDNPSDSGQTKKGQVVPWTENAKLVISALGVLSIIFAGLTFIFSAYPQLKPFNTNLTEMANAGDINSQLKLAHYHHDIGNFTESVYWYSMVYLSGCQDDRRAVACNNLGWLYAKGYGLSDEALSLKDRLKISFDLFDQSITSNQKAKNALCENRYLILATFGEEFFDDYTDKLESAKQIAEAAGLSISPLREIVSQEEEHYFSAAEGGWKGDNEFLQLTGAHAVRTEVGTGMQYDYLRIVYADGDPKYPDLIYLPVNEYVK